MRENHSGKGYESLAYASSLSASGHPIHLPKCDGWILKRPIPGTPYFDATSCYPFFACRDWTRLREDLEGLGDDLVSLVLIPACFEDYSSPHVEELFDFRYQLKNHLVTDLAIPIEKTVSRSHRTAVRRALKKVEVRLSEHPQQRLDEWFPLYSFLRQKRKISGTRAFSKEALGEQLAVPGTVVVEAFSEDEVVSFDWWYVQKDIAYGHLAASSALGYELRASYATKWFVLNHFRERVKWLDLGGVSRMIPSSQDGLSAFKKGWATGERSIHLFGKVLNQEIYDDLSSRISNPEINYFPKYRSGEF